MEIRFFDGTDNLSDALWVRDEVFTKEQGFTIPDEDEFDAVSRHMVVYREGRPPPPDGSTATRTARPSTSGASRCARPSAASSSGGC